MELVAGVVDVVLRLDRVALEPEDPRERIAHRGRARIDDDQRAGGVGRDELEEIALALARLGAAIRRALAQDVAERARAPGRAQEHVDEAGAGDLEALHGGAPREVGDDGLGDLARGLPRGPGERHRHIGGVVAVALVPGHLPEDVAHGGKPRRAQRVFEPLGQEIGRVEAHCSVVGAAIARSARQHIMIRRALEPAKKNRRGHWVNSVVRKAR